VNGGIRSKRKVLLPRQSFPFSLRIPTKPNSATGGRPVGAVLTDFPAWTGFAWDDDTGVAGPGSGPLTQAGFAGMVAIIRR